VKRAISLLSVLCLLAGPQGAISLAQPPDDLQTGIRQVQGGDFDAALLTLDAAARRLAAEGNHPKDLALAYTYLGIAYLQLGQEDAARTKMREAVRTDKDLRLDTKDFPPKIVKFFDEVRAQSAPPPPANIVSVVRPTPAPPPSPAAAPTASTATAAQGGHAKALPILLGVGGAAVVGVALAAKGGGGSTSSTLPPTPVTVLSDLSATTTSAQRSANITCTQAVTATVTLTNRGSAGVTVTGVRHNSLTVTGTCNAAQPFTFTPIVGTVAAGGTATVLNTQLFNNGSGCCNSTSACDGRTFCQIRASFTVVTNLGEVSAGAFDYGVTFSGCSICSSSNSLRTNCSSVVKED